MKNKKLLKVLVSTGGLISLSATTGTILNNFNTTHPNSTVKAPQPNLKLNNEVQQLKNNVDNNYKANLKNAGYNSSWSAFQEKARQEAPVIIVYRAKLFNWMWTPNNQFNILHIDSDQNNKTINVYIDKSVNGQLSRAVFQIKYDGQAYNSSNWKCLMLPVEVASINYKDWNNFIFNAKASQASQIVAHAHVSSWKDVKNSNLSLSHYRIDYLKETITTDVVYNNNGKFERASFEMKYQLNQPYSLNNWTTIAQPHAIQNNWTNFQTQLMNRLTPNSLLKIAQPALSYNQSSTAVNGNSLHWKHGTVKDRFWQYNDNANWDTFGATSATDAYQGMAGKPTVHNLANGQKEITAIFSRKGKSCNFNADPIKATFFFTPGDKLNFLDWNFKATPQLESYNTFNKTLIADESYLMKNKFKPWAAVDFAVTNYFKNHNDSNKTRKDAALHHTLNIMQMLAQEGVAPENSGFKLVAYPGPQTVFLKKGGTKIGVSPSIEFWFSAGFSKRFFLYLNMPTYFQNSNIADGIPSFNYEWLGSIVNTP